ALTLNGGTIKDAAATNAVRALVVGSANAGALANAKDLVVDTTAPLVGISTPANTSFQKTVAAITGTASDATSGVTGVTLTLQKPGNANGYWNGSSFTGTSGTATVFTASNTGIAFSTWSANVSTVTFADGQQYDVNMTATDAATNSGTATTSFTFDTTAPAVAVTGPAGSSFVNAVSAITGTSRDATAGVTGGSVTLQKHGDASGYWNGSAFTGTSGTATVFSASNTGTAFSTWSANVGSVTFADGQQYDVNASAPDAAGNTGSSSSSFTFDTTAPAYSS